MGVIIRQSIKGTIVNYLGAFLGFLTTFFVITEYLTKSEIGLTNVLVSAATVLSGLALMGTSSSIIRFYPDFKNSKNKDNGFFFWAIVIPLVGYVIFTLVSIFFKGPFSEYFSKQSELFVNYYYLVFPLTFFILYMTVFESYSNTLMKIVIPKLVREVILRVFLLVCYLLYAFDIVNFNGFIHIFCLSYAGATLINLLYLIKLKQISIKVKFEPITTAFKKEYFKYTLYSLINSFGITLAPLLSVFFVAGKLGLEENGVYAIATYIAVMVEIPYRSLFAIAQPELANLIKGNEILKGNELCKRLSLNQFIVGGFILLLLWVNIDLIFRIIPNGENFLSGKYVVLIIGLSKLINSILGISSSVLTYSKYFFYSIIFTAIIIFSAFGLNYVLTPILGINGSAYATLFSSILYYLFLLMFLGYKMKINLFSVAHLKVLGIMALTLALNYGIEFFRPYLINDTFLQNFIFAIIKSGIICIIAVVILYYSKVSIEINNIIDLVINKKYNNVKI